MATEVKLSEKEQDSKEQVDAILNRAKHDVKGRLYIYERYKSELQEVCLTSAQLGIATIDLAKILKV